MLVKCSKRVWRVIIKPIINQKSWLELINKRVHSSELSHFMQGELNFLNFPKKWGSVFTHKKGGLIKQSGCFKKGPPLSLIFVTFSTFQSYHSLSECWWLLCVFTPYLSEFFVFHRKSILLNLINWYVTSTNQKLSNRKDIVELCKLLILANY